MLGLESDRRGAALRIGCFGACVRQGVRQEGDFTVSDPSSGEIEMKGLHFASKLIVQGFKLVFVLLLYVASRVKFG